jgi:hypothetical protein
MIMPPNLMRPKSTFMKLSTSRNANNFGHLENFGVFLENRVGSCYIESIRERGEGKPGTQSLLKTEYDPAILCAL